MESIGVLLPVYKNDRVDFLRESIESILSQTNKNFHVFIGVDGPVGVELKGCLDNYDKLNNVTVVWFEENRGLPCVLNDLINICKREGCLYYARMDADDILPKDRFENQIHYLENNPMVDVVGGAVEEIDGNSKLRGKKLCYPLNHQDCRNFFRYRDTIPHPGAMFRRSFFEKVPNGYREEYRKNQDTMLWFDGFKNGCYFANIPNTVLFFRIADDFYGRRNGWKRAKQMLRDRFIINKTLHYDCSANLFAIMIFFITISPSFIKKMFYKIR